MDKPWLASYPKHVPAHVDVEELPSLVAMQREACRRYADRPAFTSLGVTLSFADFDRLTQAFAAHLQRTLGHCRGERLAVMLPNTLQYPVAVFGALRAGMVVVNVNPLYTSSEVAFQLKDAGAIAIVVLENFAHTVAEALPDTPVRHVVVTQIADLFPHGRREVVNFVVRHFRKPVPPWSIDGAVKMSDAIAEGGHGAPVDADPMRDEPAFLQYTGGTTGRPKGTILTHGNLAANVLQTVAWVGDKLVPGRETVVTALPLYHVFALTANLFVFVRLGGNNVLIPDPRDLPAFIAVLRHTPFTAITGVNTLFAALLDHDGFDEVCAARRGGLKLSVAGGMALQRQVAERWHQATGIPLLEGYGLTETSPIVCANPVDLPVFSGKLGLPIPSTEVAIRGDDGAELAPGGVGEICVRGPQVMRGYWNRPDETANVLTEDGWLRTGDIGRMDERGWFEFVDRKKDVIVVSGFKAFPAEIEEVARLHPGVKDAGAVGVPDERTGEAVALFVVPSEPGLSVGSVLAHCERHLAAYKRPRFVHLREELPRTALGKVLHRQLKDEARRALAPQRASEAAAVDAAA